MPRIKILNLPKYALGGPDECPEGQIFNEFTQQCEPDPNYDRNAAQPSQQGIGTGIATKVDLGPNYNYSNPRNTYVYSDGTPINKLECPQGFVKNVDGKCVPRKTGIERLSEALGTVKTVGSALAQEKVNREAERDYKRMERNKMFTGQMRSPGRAFTMGKTETQSGVEFPGLMPPPNEGMFSNTFYSTQYPMSEFGGTFGGGPRFSNNAPIRIKILEAPEMKYGGQFKGSYGLDVGWRNLYTDMSKTDAEHYGETMSEDKKTDEAPAAELEDGETLYKPGDSTLHKISGKRHSKGGVKLTESQLGSKNSDISSFVFSDTNKMKIKDKDTLAHFGVKYKKGGVTPAFISKKYDLNKYKTIIDDPTTDPLAKLTAQMMLEKNEKRLAELATIQEGMKGVEPPEFAQKKMGYAQNGGFIKKYQRGGQAEGAVFTPEMFKAFGRKKVGISERMKAGDTKVRKKQYQAGCFYGGMTPRDLEELQERHSWYFKDKPDWDVCVKEDVLDFQNEYNEKYAKKYGFTYFVPEGDTEDRNFNRLDGLFGEYTYNAPSLDEEVEEQEPPAVEERPKEEPPSVSEPRYICDSDGKGGGIIKQLPPGMSGGYSSEAEASQNCPGPAVVPPYDYLLPDKVNMLAKAAIFPEVIFPMIPQIGGTPTGLNLGDWRAPAATAFSVQYAAPAEQLAQYTSPQGLTANLSALAGQAAQNITGQIMPRVTSENIDRANAYQQAEAARQDEINRFNLLQRQKGYEGWATARQQYRNALRGYLKENSDAFTRAWNNRMELGLINDSNTQFYLDPFSGRQNFYNPNMRGVAGLRSDEFSNSGVENLGDNFSDFYGTYYEQISRDPRTAKLTSEEKSKAATDLAMNAIRAGKETTTRSSRGTTSTKRTGFNFGS